MATSGGHTSFLGYMCRAIYWCTWCFGPCVVPPVTALGVKTGSAGVPSRMVCAIAPLVAWHVPGTASRASHSGNIDRIPVLKAVPRALELISATSSGLDGARTFLWHDQGSPQASGVGELSLTCLPPKPELMSPRSPPYELEICAQH